MEASYVDLPQIRVLPFLTVSAGFETRVCAKATRVIKPSELQAIQWRFLHPDRSRCVASVDVDAIFGARGR